MLPIKERRKRYAAMESKGFTDDEVVRLMDMDELEMNANRGGVLAKKELKRRKSIADLKPMPRDINLDLGV